MILHDGQPLSELGVSPANVVLVRLTDEQQVELACEGALLVRLIDWAAAAGDTVDGGVVRILLVLDTA